MWFTIICFVISQMCTLEIFPSCCFTYCWHSCPSISVQVCNVMVHVNLWGFAYNMCITKKKKKTHMLNRRSSEMRTWLLCLRHSGTEMGSWMWSSITVWKLSHLSHMSPCQSPVINVWPSCLRDHHLVPSMERSLSAPHIRFTLFFSQSVLVHR